MTHATTGESTYTSPNTLPNVHRRITLRNAVYAASLGLYCITLVGCTSDSDTPPSPPNASASHESKPAAPSIPIYSDKQFLHRIGQTAGYNIICVFRKDIANNSIQPANVHAYWVKPDEPQLPKSFVDPSHAGLVGGMSPDCSNSNPPKPVPYMSST